MKKSLSLLAVLAVAGTMGSQAQAADRYVSALAGISWMNDINIQDTYDGGYTMNLITGSGFTGAAAVGCDYGSTRAELEIGYQHNKIKSGIANYYYDGEDFAASGSVNILSLMVNGYYDIPLGKGAELYALAGIGGAQVTFKDFVFGGVGPYTADQTTLAWQVGAGVAIPVGDKVKLDLRYRYFATTDFEFDDQAMYPIYDWLDEYNGRMNISSHSLMAGIRVTL